MLMNNSFKESTSKLTLDHNFENIIIPYGFNKHMLIQMTVKNLKIKLESQEGEENRIIKIPLNRTKLYQMGTYEIIMKGFYYLPIISKHILNIRMNEITDKRIQDSNFFYKIETILSWLKIGKNNIQITQEVEIKNIIMKNQTQKYNEDFIQTIKWIFIILTFQFDYKSKTLLEDYDISINARKSNQELTFVRRNVDEKVNGIILTKLIENINIYLIPKSHKLKHDEIYQFHYIEEDEEDNIKITNMLFFYKSIIMDLFTKQIITEYNKRLTDKITKVTNTSMELAKRSKMLEFLFLFRRIFMSLITVKEMDFYLRFSYQTKRKDVSKYLPFEISTKLDYFHILLVQKEQNNFFTQISFNDIIGIAENISSMTVDKNYLVKINEDGKNIDLLWTYYNKDFYPIEIKSINKLQSSNVILNPYLNTVFPKELRLFLNTHHCSDPISRAARCYLQYFDKNGSKFWETFILTLYSWYINKRDISRGNIYTASTRRKDILSSISIGEHVIRLSNGILLTVYSSFSSEEAIMKLKFGLTIHPLSIFSSLLLPPTSKNVQNRIFYNAIADLKHISFFSLKILNENIRNIRKEMEDHIIILENEHKKLYTELKTLRENKMIIEKKDTKKLQQINNRIKEIKKKLTKNNDDLKEKIGVDIQKFFETLMNK
jgi:hypothetical protein